MQYALFSEVRQSVLPVRSELLVVSESTDQRSPVIRVLNGNLHPVAGTLPSDPALTSHLGQQSGERDSH